MMKTHKIRRLNWAILTVLALMGLNSGAILDIVFSSKISPFIAPHPQQLFDQLVKTPMEWTKAIIWTASMSLFSAIIATTIGLLIGFFAAYLRLSAIERWAQLVWSIPLIASATYFLLAVGHGWVYGLSLGVFLGFYPIVKHVYDYCVLRSEGISSVAASFALSRWRQFWHLRLPGALQNLGTALAQALPLCFIGETMGEYTSAKISTFSVVLGGILRFSQSYSNYPRLWVAIILMMLLVFGSGEASKILWSRLFPQRKLGDSVQ